MNLVTKCDFLESCCIHLPTSETLFILAYMYIKHKTNMLNSIYKYIQNLQLIQNRGSDFVYVNI